MGRIGAWGGGGTCARMHVCRNIGCLGSRLKAAAGRAVSMGCMGCKGLHRRTFNCLLQLSKVYSTSAASSGPDRKLPCVRVSAVLPAGGTGKGSCFRGDGGEGGVMSQNGQAGVECPLSHIHGGYHSEDVDCRFAHVADPWQRGVPVVSDGADRASCWRGRGRGMKRHEPLRWENEVNGRWGGACLLSHGGSSDVDRAKAAHTAEGQWGTDN